MDAGEQLAGVKAASFTAAGAGMSEYVYCPGMDVDNKRFTANRKAFGSPRWTSGVRFVDTDLETFPAGGHVKAAKDQAARSAGVQHVALWPSAAKGVEICFTAAHRRRPGRRAQAPRRGRRWRHPAGADGRRQGGDARRARRAVWCARRIVQGYAARWL